ncbi:MAG: hypothetical protein DHS20C11_16750 [Lysobacteraceae bacterium]|nr:MAG: hypothetical protein DHS20C11_16750 [Xanthomonadaceae bacterium]
MSDFDYGTLGTAEQRRDYYREQGYVVVPSLLSRRDCSAVIDAFRCEVKPFEGHIYRQASANPEEHKWTPAGTMLNSILNPVAVNPRQFPRFRDLVTRMLASDALFGAASELYDEAAGLVQSMYFEGNPATWAHQDCYYLDSTREGDLMGAWLALEDIDPRSGQFYVMPGSHRLDLLPNEGATSIAYNHDAYKQHVLDQIETHGLEKRSPRLNAGDVLFWGSRVIHGADEPVSHEYSRNSLTAHFIPLSSDFLQYQKRIRVIEYDQVGGNMVSRPKDQAQLKNRLMLGIEARLPGPFQWLKRRAVAAALR